MHHSITQRFAAVHCRTGSSENAADRGDSGRAFTAAQAAQKIPAIRPVAVARFTAAQAAQKYPLMVGASFNSFTAAQAAQKSGKSS